MAATWALLLLTCLALQAFLLWGSARSQVTGFLSIDCGSDAASTDLNGIEWVADVDYIKEGKSLPVTGGRDRVLGNLRLFDGNQSKYCYSLANNAVQAGNFFLVRASIWAGISPPYTPRNSDGHFRFKLIVDGDVWEDVKVPYGTTTWYTYDIYMRAQGDKIDVCFARSTPDGDAPFINGLELRPLPSTLTSTIIMNGTGVLLVPLDRTDYGALSTMPSTVRYPSDPLDRIWLAYTSEAGDVNTTEATIDTDQIDKPPAQILQTAFMGKPYVTLNYTNLDPNVKYLAELYFAEIDPAVNASGQRVFNIFANGDLVTTLGDIDVFARVGANAAFGYPAVVSPNADGILTFNFTPTTTSIYPAYLAAAEFFSAKLATLLTSASVVSAVEEVKAGLGLSSYAGDPCLPLRFGYNWLNCSGTTITSLSLSNYQTGGTIAEAINTLTSLTEIYMDGNDLQGEIPDLGALTNLKVLDLSNNGLHGSIPDSLATLKNLKVLNLQNNNLSGEIPAALLQRKQASTLDFEFSGNPLCETNAGVTCSVSPTPSTPRGNTPSSDSSTKKKSNIGVIIGAAVAGILVVGIGVAVAVYCFCCRNRPSSTLEQPINKHQSSQQELSRRNQTPVITKVIPKSLYEFTFQEIKDATNNFSSQIGKGGFGPVYKGSLQDGRLVAIKVASNASNQGSKEFLNEVDLLSRIHHKNLVGFVGYCNEENLVLVYEFMSNGSLYDCLHGPYAKASPLSWTTRLRIVVDAAQGFDYLHYGCNPRIIHRDIKSSNILLNDHLEAKISDFGISRNTVMNETGAPPTALMGSMGYMDPEYLSSMKLTEKVDVYSFGVLLFEVICGRTAVFIDDSGQQFHIVEWAKSSIERGVIDDIVDASLHRQYDNSSVWKVLEIAMACVHFSSSQRPRMSAVYHELKEAERMELESDHRNVFDTPSVEFTTGGSDSNAFSYTHVNAR
ncbi:hypothetical protein GOP47_0022090 [Adiantum capillus-veneris]|uniref:non-specific serine/threonine protein kinase n=1 Tax=Adiantum capillus-veneris TaxID=13818 RepID=A0A9D4U9M2_ADICA|nr:hypothetical protein GOP47_0022090 [Adiantum capillus-veneris]